MSRVACLVAIAMPLNATAAEPATYAHGFGEHLGTVNLSVSCKDAARVQVTTGLQLLHHMMYEGAEESFVVASRAQPDCAMAYWGQAMTLIHPIWSDPPNAQRFEKGAALVKLAKRHAGKTALERAYIAAVEAYFAPGRGTQEAPNLSAFERGWAHLHEQFPDDPESTLFYALTLLATADPTDKTFANRHRAGSLAEKVLARNPDHPGAHHYIIHAYDAPSLAENALTVARQYARIAPEVPHALHMPTHIFTRLGLWKDSIAWNERAGSAGLKHPLDGTTSMHFMHAADYLVYAHLQRGEDRKAIAIRNSLAQLERVQVDLASAYAFAGAPARIALERQQWADAAALEPRTPSTYPWDGAPAIEAITQFAKALGAARTGNDALAHKSIERLATLRDQAAASQPYWGKQVEMQRTAALAWVTLAGGKRTEAVAMMRQAADMESSTDKHPVTPGEVLPMRELLADMLLETGDHAGAQREYEATLERSPKRFNSLYGAGRAAELRGDVARATSHYKTLVEIAVEADPVPDRLRHARELLQMKR